MLAIIRKNTWFTKILLFFVAAVFIIFFGSDTLRQGAGTQNGVSPASVNGQSINALKVNFLLEQKMESLKTYFKDKVPDNILDMIKNEAVNSLINQELLRQELQKLGISTLPKELADFVKEQPQFAENGQFNKDLYLNENGYRTWYQQRTGSSYEEDTKFSLAAQKLFAQFDQIAAPAPAELERLNKVQNTKFQFSVIRVSKTPPVAVVNKEDGKTAEAPKADFQPKETAELIYTLWKSKADIKKTLESNKLAISETGELSYADLGRVFDGKEDTQKIAELIKLTPDKPSPATYFEQDNFYYLVKLTDLKKSTAELSAESLADLKKTYQSEASSKLQAALIKDLRSQAKIEMK